MPLPTWSSRIHRHPEPVPTPARWSSGEFSAHSGTGHEQKSLERRHTSVTRGMFCPAPGCSIPFIWERWGKSHKVHPCPLWLQRSQHGNISCCNRGKIQRPLTPLDQPRRDRVIDRPKRKFELIHWGNMVPPQQSPPFKYRCFLSMPPSPAPTVLIDPSTQHKK